MMMSANQSEAKHAPANRDVSGYDIIGDIHGHAAKLEALLAKLGYQYAGGLWRHDHRTAVFVGDFIDRGPEQVRTCEIVRNMMEAGAALAVMGNHEFNALAFHTPDGRGGYLRQHDEKTAGQHRAFLEETNGRRELRKELLSWFMELPLWLDLGALRVVHACWHEPLMRKLQAKLRPGNRLDYNVLRAAADDTDSSSRDGGANTASLELKGVQTLLKGIEVELPEGGAFLDKDGHRRESVRIKWWLNGPSTYRSAALVPPKALGLLSDGQVPPHAAPGYSGPAPVFLGHYWMTGVPTLLGTKIACVDYSAGKDGPLVAYRWSGETELDACNFTCTAGHEVNC